MVSSISGQPSAYSQLEVAGLPVADSPAFGSEKGDEPANNGFVPVEGALVLFEVDPAAPMVPKRLPPLGPEAGVEIVGALELPNTPLPAVFKPPNRAPLVPLVDEGVFSPPPNELPPVTLSADELPPNILLPMAGDIFEPPPKRPVVLPNKPAPPEDDAGFEVPPNMLPPDLLEAPEPKMLPSWM